MIRDHHFFPVQRSSAVLGRPYILTVTATMSGERKVFRAAEVKEHSDGKSPWIIINNEIFDVTNLVRVHPGGDQVLVENAGGDATEAFEDVGHSIDARELKKTFYVGDLHPDDCITHVEKPGVRMPTEKTTVSQRPLGFWWMPLAAILMGILVYNAFN